jgi:hypothetical protein
MTMRLLLIAAVALALTAACSEKPPRPDPEHNAAINLQKGSNATAERTLEQGEAERMGL